ncbi:MAG: glycosyltransferase family 4 protein [Bacteroidales bacterium]|nr:glycosyltransferase family 4 protein [Bacteroidales bacterium]
MKILFLTPYFMPEQMASSHLDDNRYSAFADAGFDMVVYTPVPTRGINEEVRRKYKAKKYETLYDGMMTVHRFNLVKERRNPILRAFRYTWSCIKQFNRAVSAKDARSCDVMFVVSTPPIQGAMAAMIKKILHKPFIYNLQDIFPDSLVGTGLAKKNGLLWKIGRVIENFTYRNADKIIVISQDFKRNIMAKGVPEEKIEVIYNWVDEQAVVNIPRKENKLFEKYNLNPNKFYVTYCGNIGLTQNMDLLLDVAKELASEENIHFVLVGEGADKERVKSRVKNENVNNVSFLPFQPYEDISHVFSLGDAGLIISKPGVGENSVPSKTWSIMSAERPVIANFDENEIKTILAENDCGIFTKAGDKVALKNAIFDLYNDKDKAVQLGKNGREFIMNNLTREIGTRKYVEAVRRTVNSINK